MKHYLLAIDIGTSGAKLLLWDLHTGKTFSRTASYPTASPAPGWAEQSPDAWWNAVRDTLPALLRENRIDPAEIAAIGVDGISWTPVLLDAEDRVLCSSPLWYDTRSSEQCREILRTVGEREAFLCGGNPVQPYYSLPKLLWMRDHHPDIWEKTRSILSANGYIVLRLTGAKTQDLSQAYGYAFFDMGSLCWNTAMAEKLGIDPALLPVLCESTHIAGTVTREAAEACGLCEGIPVVAGGLDAACGAVGAGTVRPGVTHEQSGSAGGMSICDTAYHPVEGLILSRHVVPGEWLLQGGTVGGGNLIRWLKDSVLRRTEPDALARMTAEASSVAPGSDGLLFLPYMSGERSPIWNPDACGVFFGLDYSKQSGHMVRSVMEGAAYALRHNLEYAEKSGAEIGILHCVGGGAFNPLWMQIKADITGHTLTCVDVPDATALGCCVVAGLGAGVLPSFDGALRDFVRPGAVYTPDPAAKAACDAGYKKYLALYERLKDLMIR